MSIRHCSHLLSALCLHLHLPNGFSNRMLRGHVAALQGKPAVAYTRGQMTYDLRRLRRKGLIERLPNTHRYVVTFVGRRIALFFTKTFARVVRRGLARLDIGAPEDATDMLAAAWRRLDRALDDMVAHARLVA